MTHYRQRLQAGEFDPSGATEATADAPAAAGPPAVDLDAMTKQELLDHARAIGVSPANNDMTKAELRAAIDAHEEA